MWENKQTHKRQNENENKDTSLCLWLVKNN